MGQHGSVKQRSSVFALVEGISVAGFMVGPVFGGWCADHFGNQEAFWVVSCINAANLVIATFTYPETLAKDKRRPFSWIKANPFASMLMWFKTKTVLMLGLVMVAGGLCAGGSSVRNLYLKNLNGTDMSGTMIGLVGSIHMGASCFGLILMMPLLSRVLSLQYVITLGMLDGVLVWLLQSMAGTTSEFLVANAMGVLLAVHFPVVRTGMTITFGRERYGESLAAVAIVGQLMSMLTKVIFTTIYAQTVDASLGPIHCIAFFVSACCGLLGVVASISITEMPTDRRANEELKVSVCESAVSVGAAL